MKSARRTLGDRGEDEACEYLLGMGHKILERNWTGGHLEIDIITFYEGVLHFVEVKSRTAPITAEPEINVTAAKQKRVSDAALKYIHSKGTRKIPFDAEIVFDVITIVFEGGDTHITYYPQAFIPTYV